MSFSSFSSCLRTRLSSKNPCWQHRTPRTPSVGSEYQAELKHFYDIMSDSCHFRAIGSLTTWFRLGTDTNTQPSHPNCSWNRASKGLCSLKLTELSLVFFIATVVWEEGEKDKGKASSTRGAHCILIAFYWIWQLGVTVLFWLSTKPKSRGCEIVREGCL